ncbi:MAG: sodium/solute symporter [Bacteroidales bacterium]
MKKLLLVIILTIVPILAFSKDENSLKVKLTETDNLQWEKQLELPADSAGKPNLGLAGAFSGYIDNSLVIMGGSNFPNGKPSDGGVKKYYGDTYIYDEEKGWQVFYDNMPKAVAYGVAFTYQNSLICVGGCDNSGCFSDVFKVSIGKDGVPVFEKLPSLPVTLANMTGCIVDGKAYIAGGNENEKPKIATAHFFSIDLHNPANGWQELQSWPGPARGYAVSACQSNGVDNCFYLFSGRNYKNDDWTILDDGYCYDPKIKEWKVVKGIFSVMAGAALPFGTNHIMFFGGRSADSKGDNSIRLYHTVTGTMIESEIDSSDVVIPVTATALKNGSAITIVSGEVAPGVRSPLILRAAIHSVVHKIKALDVIVIAIYFLILAFVGWWFSKRQKSTSDYFKGGGRVSWFIVGLSIFGTSLSAITFMSLPAKAYLTDWSYLLFNAGIILVVPLITLVFIPFFRKLDITTSYEYLEMRFNALIRVICSISFILFQIGRMAVVLLLPSIALNVVSGFDIYLCIGLMGVLSLAYTMMGGIEAVVWTEAIQVVVLLGATVAIVVSVINGIPGGGSSLMAAASEAGKFSLGETFFDLRQPVIWTVLIATVFTNITTYGTDQTIVQRYFTTKSVKEARKGVYTNAVLTIPASLLFFFLGTALWAFYKYNPGQLSVAVADSDAILPWYITTSLPQGVLGLVIAGLFAAAMSTISSSMNASSMAFTMDIFHKIKPGCDNGTSMKAARLSTLIIGMFGILLAVAMVSWDIKSLWDEFNKFLGLLLGGLGGLFLLGMMTKRANSAGALCGLAGCIIVQFLVIKFQTVNLLLYSTTGFISCFIIGYIASLAFHPDHKEITPYTIYKK